MKNLPAVRRPTTVSLKTVENQAKRINDAWQRASNARFVVIDRIADAFEKLGEEAFQKDLAPRLSMSASQFSKFKTISECKPLMQRKKHLPVATETLYQLTRLHKLSLKVFGDDKGTAVFKANLKKFDKRAETADVIAYVDNLKDRIDRRLAGQKERQLLALDGPSKRRSDFHSKVVPFEKAPKSTYRTIVVALPLKDMAWCSQIDVMKKDVADRFPFENLRAPSLQKGNLCVVWTQSQFMNGAVKLLEANGYGYRGLLSATPPPKTSDVFGPRTSTPHLHRSFIEVNVGVIGTRKGREIGLTTEWENPSATAEDGEWDGFSCLMYDVNELSRRNGLSPNLVITPFSSKYDVDRDDIAIAKFFRESHTADTRKRWTLANLPQR